MDQPPVTTLAEARANLAYNDDLTGLFNRRVLAVLFEHLWAGLLKEHRTAAVLVIDLDHFKEVNDTYGHLVGDQVLSETAAILRRHFRGDDILVRYGGDEFVVVLPGAGLAEAGKLAERARNALTEHQFAAAADDRPMTVPVSFSLGVAAYPADGDQGEALLDVADMRLLEDKRLRHSRGESAEAPSLGSRATWALGATVAVALVVAGMWLLHSAGSPGGPAPTPLAVRGLDPEREAALLAQIKALQEQLMAVRAERASATDSDTRQGSERRIEELTSTIAELEQRLGGSVPPPDAVSTGTTPVPDTPAQDQPVTSPPPATPQPPVSPSPTAVEATNVPETEVSVPGPILVAPVLVHYEPPVYPEVARKLRKEAAIELRVLVDVSGRVTRVEPVGPPVGFGLDVAARNAAFRATYRPGTRSGSPVPMTTTLVIQFRLTGAL